MLRNELTRHYDFPGAWHICDDVAGLHALLHAEVCVELHAQVRAELHDELHNDLHAQVRAEAGAGPAVLAGMER